VSDYDRIVAGIPQLREAGWLITGKDHDPVRHLLVRMQEHMDGTGTWTVELYECRGRRGDAGNAMHSYVTETDARAALNAIYQLSRHLTPLPTWQPQKVEPGRWRTHVYEPTQQDLRQRHREQETPTADRHHDPQRVAHQPPASVSE
jgi:hypothetical protein